ncbi:hypothetical protein VM1G_05212 [Cytospora mali]|uniref:Rhodopsin domain-containing protein n=1 Tax=Cytospora mali TaxID=578113 RepID=A0A194W0W9_CYTMA|nr:hypothetical protein VM1G_05212 [Valsa mali]
MLIAILIRNFVRTRFLKNWGWDDAACNLAAVGSLSHTVLYSQMIKVGFGRHLWDIPASWLMKTSNVQLLSGNGITYPVTIFFAKLSILLLYIRIFSVNSILRMTIYTVVVILALFYSAMIGLGIGSIITCTGVQAETTAFCQTYSGPIVLVNGSFNAVTDFLILALPFPLLSKLQLRFKHKVGLGAVFAAGLAACAASLARLIEFGINYKTSDVLWVQATNAMFSSVEINVAIIVACVSCFPTFYNHTKTYMLSTTSLIRKRLVASKGSSQKSEQVPFPGSIDSLIMKSSTSARDGHPWMELGQAPPTRGNPASFTRVGNGSH